MSFGDRNEIRLLRNRYENKRASDEERMVVGDASTVGISNPHMSNIERGKTKVSLATLIDIANALDTTFDALIRDNLVKGKVVFDEEISQELEECSEEDIRIVYDMVKALVKSLAKRKH